jgi:Zn-finger nucleic acid-binding protein
VDCPKCAGKLQETKLEGETLDVCFLCEGVWFDHKELNEIIRKDAVNFKTWALDNEAFDAKEIGDELDLNHKRGKCPRCGRLMDQSSFRRGLWVDSCGDGHGLWLDGGEVHKLRKRRLVEFVDRFKFAFSETGFRTLIGKFKGR